MVPEYEGFCAGCNSWNEHLQVRFCFNGFSNKPSIRKFCPECRVRFHLNGNASETQPSIEGGDSYGRSQDKGY